MKRKRVLFHCLSMLLSACIFSFFPAPTFIHAQTIVLTNANVVDGVTDNVLSNVSL